jgi:hypothetical protein
MIFGRPFSEKAEAHGFTSNTAFRSSFNKILQGKAKKKNVKGIDNARGLGQAIAKVQGRNNSKRTKLMPNVNPVAAALQHSVRNRSVEQGANLSTRTQSLAAAMNNAQDVLKLRGS